MVRHVSLHAFYTEFQLGFIILQAAELKPSLPPPTYYMGSLTSCVP